jgi:hypothetical protein
LPKSGTMHCSAERKCDLFARCRQFTVDNPFVAQFTARKANFVFRDEIVVVFVCSTEFNFVETI